MPPVRSSPSVDGKLVLVASHSVLAHRRYNPIVADLKCVLNIEGVPQRFLKACFTEWTKILVMVQVCACGRKRGSARVALF